MLKRVKNIFFKRPKIKDAESINNPWDVLLSVNYDNPNTPEFNLKRLYAIAFTPRSGSSWLTDVLIESKRIGKPNEWFNTNFPSMKKSIVEYKCNTIDEYYTNTKHKHKTKNNVFGFEITWFQAQKVFDYNGSDQMFDDVETWFWLRRKDFVAQGISLFKTAKTGRFHSTENKENIPVEYDFEQICHWTLHILEQEYFFNQYFIKNSIEPLELWYEDNVDRKKKTIRMFYKTLNLKAPGFEDIVVKSKHKKIADQDSEYMLEKFCKENADFIDYWNLNRGKVNTVDFIKEFPKYGQ